MTEEEIPATPGAESGEQRQRVVVDAEGRRWAVYESPLPYDRRATSSLVFVASDVMRRVRNFPPDWFEWPDAALLDLSNRA